MMTLVRLAVSFGAAVLLASCGPVGSTTMPPTGPGVPDAAKSTLSFDAAQGVANNTTAVNITATVRDSAGAGVGNVKVTFVVSGTGNQLADVGTTQGDGVRAGALSSSKAERKTLTATFERAGAQVPFGGELSIDFVAGPPEGFAFLVQPRTTKAGEPISPAVKLEVLDKDGNRATGAFSASLRLVRATSGTVQGGTTTAAVDGVITFDNLVINRPQMGYALRAEAAGGAAGESALFDVTLGELSANTSTLTAAPVNVLADGVATSTLTATLRDTGGNPLPGVSLTLAATGTGNTLGATTGTSDGAGVFTTTLSSTVAEPKTITLTSGTVVLGSQVTFIP